MTSTLPWATYVDEAVLAREQEAIFRHAWQYVGHAGQLGCGGSFFAARVGDVPVVVTRDGEGELRALLNVCRHRGSLVAEGAGERESLQCPYHAWTYGLDGRLVRAPRAEREEELDGEALGLLPLQVGTWGPFVFVNPDRAAPPLDEVLRELPRQVAEAGIDVDTLEFRLRTTSTLEANWKLVCENFLECYHCPVAHPGFAGIVDVSPDSYRLEVGETFSSQFGLLRQNGRAAYDTAGEIRHSQFHFLWPNTGINIFPGRPNLSIGPILPAGPRRTERYLDYFFAEDVEDTWVEELLAFDDQIGVEDRRLVESVQRGVASGLVEAGRLMGESEVLIGDFQRRVRDALSLEAPVPDARPI
jgi:choline monooxygenase